jgi:hypothetical protein
MRDWLKPALLVASLLVILTGFLYLRGEPAPTGSGLNPDNLLMKTGEAPNERSGHSDSAPKTHGVGFGLMVSDPFGAHVNPCR